MNELIKVGGRTVGNEAVQTVNARELHGFLGVGKDFSDWIKTQVDRARLVEGRDYIKISHSPEKGSGNRGARIDYHLTLDAGKHVAMMSGTDKGFQVREYFLACEKRLKSLTVPQVPQTLPEALRLAADLAEKNAQQAVLIEEQKPSVEFVQKYAEAESTKCLGDVAKVLGHKPHAFSRQLASDGIVFKRDDGWLLIERRP